MGESSIEPVTLDRGQVATIGRAPECDLCLPDKSVSRKHASVEWREAAWFVTDLGSTQGTTLSGERLDPHQPVILRDGDSLQIGRHSLHVTVTDDPEPPRQEPFPAGKIEFGPRGGVGEGYRTRASIFLRLRGSLSKCRLQPESGR